MAWGTPDKGSNVTESRNSIDEAAVALRRALHRRPELTWQEFETAKTIRAELDRAKIPWRVCAETGTIGTIAPAAKGPHLALRADIDALPIHEATGVAWASEAPGRMHACGHDGHTATLFAAAWWLKRHEATLPGPVSLFFQPAEEGGHGAKRMIEEGALEGVDMIYGWHNWPAIPFGKAICPDGVVMAANGTFSIDVVGRGGHASQPEQCRDPVVAAAAIVLALQQVVSRRLPPQLAAVVSVTTMHAPGVETIVPDSVRIGGSIRLADSNRRDLLRNLMNDAIENTARAYGVDATLKMLPRYDATVNNPIAATQFRAALAEEFGEAWKSHETLLPVMASEDFSYYLKEVPGAFALIGADDGPAHAIGCHSARYDFNDALIPVVSRVLSRLCGVTLL